jgi:hypothetical protein
MSVNITFPANDGDQLPGTHSWGATATYGTNDAVDGYVLDLASNNIYPSNNPSYVFDSGTGIYTWTVPFQTTPQGGTQVAVGDSLYIDCYDAETGDNDGTRTAVASAVELKKGEKKGTPPTIKIDSVSMDGTTLLVSVTKSKGVKGYIRVVLASTNDIKHPVSNVLFQKFVESDQKCNGRFDGIDATKWTYIYVVAVIKGHQGHPDKYRVKPK